MTHMEELTSKEFAEFVDKRTVAILPVGAVEEHGAHLPLSTDILQPVYVAEETARALEGKLKVLIAPTLSYGLCQSTLHFPGTITLSFDTLRALAFEVIKGLADNGLRNIVVLSGHAGRSHMIALRLAAERVLNTPGYENLRLMVLSDYDIAYQELGKDFPATDGHGGELETSRVLAIRPDLVKGSSTPSYPEFPPYRIIRDAERYFPSGIMGDPGPATAEKGKGVNEKVVREFADLLIKMVEEPKR